MDLPSHAISIGAKPQRGCPGMHATVRRVVDQSEVAISVASSARVAGHAAAAVAPHDGRRMRVHVVALRGPVARRMTVHAPRIHDDLCGLCE